MLTLRLLSALGGVLLALLSGGADGARILAVVAIPSPSHGIWNRVLIEALADKGHHIDALIPFPGKNRTGLTYYDIGGHFEDDDMVGFSTLGALAHIDVFFDYALQISGVQSASPAVRQLLIEPKTLSGYDLILYEACCSESLAGAFSKTDAPVVAIDAYADAAWNWEAMGVANPPSVYHQPLYPYRVEMSFWERANSFVYALYNKYSRSNYLRGQQAIARHMYGKRVADLKDVETKFEMLLMNSGVPGLDLGRTLPPNVKEVGCLHCKPGNSENLPTDVKSFLDEAKDGFVYFSLGSNIKSSLLPEELIKGILSVLEKLKPLKVLWKFEKADLPGKPDNVKINPWLPQQDVLGHENIRLFISHGGRLSLQESIYHGVPVFVVPFFADQYLNGERMVENGMGLRMNFFEFDITVFEHNINKIISDNARFKAAAKRLSNLARDQPETPLERAVYWIEYVLRHGGAEHLRPPGTHLNWFQLHSLDVIGLFLISAAIPVALAAFAFKSCVSKKPISSKKKQ